MATSRRAKSVSSRPTGRAPASSALEPNVPVNSDGDEQASDESSRRVAAGGRNSRRMKAQSSASMPVARKSARLLTPEEQLARKQGIKNFFVLILCLALFIGSVGAGWYFFLRENPLAREAQMLLVEGDAKLLMIAKSLDNRQPAKARESFNEGLKLLAVPMLGNAKEPIDEHDAALASVGQASKAVELVKKIRATETRVDKVERDLKEESNHRTVMAGFSKLSDLNEADLVELEKNAGLFLKNPVEPPLGDRDEYMRDYPTLIQEVQAQMFRIEQEKDRREESITSDQVRLAHGEVKALVKQEQFKDALTKLDEYKAKYATANFDSLRSFVEEAGKKAWESAEKYANSRYIDYKAPGIPKAIGDQALKDARARLQQVVDRFGIDEYVGQAKALLEKYPTP